MQKAVRVDAQGIERAFMSKESKAQRHAMATGSAMLACCRTDKIEAFGEALPMLEFAAAETRKRAPHLTHPHLCLEAIKYGVEHGGLAGLRKVIADTQEEI